MFLSWSLVWYISNRSVSAVQVRNDEVADHLLRVQDLLQHRGAGSLPARPVRSGPYATEPHGRQRRAQLRRVEGALRYFYSSEGQGGVDRVSQGPPTVG